jgi:hypothetical protein
LKVSNRQSKSSIRQVKITIRHVKVIMWQPFFRPVTSIIDSRTAKRFFACHFFLLPNFTRLFLPPVTLFKTIISGASFDFFACPFSVAAIQISTNSIFVSM